MSNDYYAHKNRRNLTHNAAIWFYDDSLTQINYDDNGGTDNFSKISQEELAAGTYFIKVDEYGNNDTISLYNIKLTVEPQSEQCVEGYGATANTPSFLENYLVNLRFINNCSNNVTIQDVEISFHDITTGNCVQKCYQKGSGYDLTPGESDLIGEQTCNVDPDTDPCSNDPLVPGEYLLVYKLKINDEWRVVKERTVEVLGSSTGDSFEPDNSSSSATTINPSFSQNHSIIPEDDEDWLKFTLNSPSNITIETTGESGDTELWLYDDSLTQINYDDNGGTDNFSKISQEELAAGIYFIKVDEYGNNDTISLYNVRLTVDPLLNSSSFSWNLFLPAILAGASDDETISTVTSPATGRVWMDRNLGASRVATSMTDTEAYGSLYQWGRRTDGHEKRNSPTTTTLSPTDVPGHGNFIVNNSEPYDWRTSPNNNLWQGESGINNPCPTGFRLPTESELQAEVDTWSSEDAAGAFGSVLKMPAAGYRNFDSGSLVYEATSGVYWTSTIDESQTDGHNIPSLFFNNSGYAGMSSFGHVLGGSVRCIKDEPELVSTVTSATGRIWMDRNIGASRVATSITDEQAYGDLYQWGRLTDGHEKRAHHDPILQTTSTLSTADDPDHDDFITVSASPYDWRDGQNDSLWQGVGGINNPCSAGFRLPTADEWQAEINQYGSTGTALFDSPLKLVAAGYRYRLDGTLSLAGSVGSYWSSSVDGTSTRYLRFDSGNTDLTSSLRAFGFSVRCIQD
ncbi:hypothetical protein GMJAKD_02870 [Candidatus Electrothrix aarhusensis]